MLKAEKVKKIVEDEVEQVEIKDERRVRAVVDKEFYRDVVQEVRDHGVYKIITISATDLGEEIEVLDHFDCGEGVVLDLKVNVSKDEGTLVTITDIFPGAVFYERELIDMLGLEIEGHPDPRRIYLAEDWPEHKHPLREGMFNYLKLSEKNVSEIKEIADDEDFDFEKMLSAEKDNRNRKSLVEWLEDKVEENEEEEDEE